MNLSRVIATAVVIFCLPLFLAEASWVNLDKNNLSQDPTVKILEANEFSCVLELSLPGIAMNIYDSRQYTDCGTEIFNLISIGEYAYTGDLGKPRLPMISQVLDVPYQAKISVDVVEADYQEYRLAELGQPLRIVPALASVSKASDGKAQFVIDEAIYTADAYYPEKVAQAMESGGLARGHRLATLQVFPIHYNPVRGEIRCYTKLKIKVNFLGGDILLTRQSIEKNYSRVWEDFIKKMVVNYPGYLKDPPGLPVYYDIFYNSAFSNAAESLACWKMKKGYRVRKWDATGWSANAIGDTIEAQTPAATFLAVIADPNSSTPLPASGNGSASGDQTDLYYAEIDGSGYLPDMFFARISVLDANQADIAIRKAIRYEHGDFGTAGTAWLKKAFFVAGYDPYGMQSVGMATNWYCRNLLIPYGYTVDTICCSSGEQQTRVVDAINSGYAWCVYTAHGGQTEWSVGYSGNFTVTELTNQTTNLDMYPMPCGHCCLTGDYQWFSNCFGETWDRLEGKGGICYFGSVPSTYWDEDDWLQRRYFDAIYTDSIEGHLYDNGRFTQWGLYWIENHTYSSLKRYYFEAYHIFNDPALDFWTDVPDSMIVTYDTISAPGPNSITVTVYDNDGVTPLENALVCCWLPGQDSLNQEVSYTDVSGTATLSVYAASGDTMYVTVTKHNYLPFESSQTNPYSIVEDNGNAIANLSTGVKNIYPVPAARTVNIQYQIARPGKVEIDIYDVSGRSIKRLICGASNPGDYSASWSGRDAAGHEVPNGIYFVHFTYAANDNERQTSVDKVILLR